ncbi:proteinase B [Cryptotrichosporon argae]
MRISISVLLALIPYVLATPITTPPDAPVIAPLRTTGEHIDDAYIVVFKKGINRDQIALHLADVEGWHGTDPLNSFTSDGEVDFGGINHVYAPSTSKFNYFGYAGKFSQSTLDAIRASPDVAYVEHDQVIRTYDVPAGVDEPLAASGMSTELGAPWGLARISHREPLHLSTFQKYLYDSHGGEGVTAYVIDTGINVDHVEFEGRARWGKTIPKNDVDKDGNGHGTHCAGTIASRKYGVAKAAEVVAVKVLGSNGSGTMSDVVAGVVWAGEQAAEAEAKAAKELAATGKTKHKGSVANMSLGGGKAQTLDDAVDAAVEAGLHFAVAAGNDNKDACSYSPAASKRAITVGASTLGDSRAYFSNHGKCVDVFAPGLNILSTWNSGNSSTNTISGTSMASPHIAGLLAYLLSIEGSKSFGIHNVDAIAAELVAQPSLYAQAYSLLPKLAQAILPEPVIELVAGDDEFAPVPMKISPAQLKKALIGLASPGLITDLPSGTPNLLAFNNATLAKK